ncbi:hypothetical protein DYQ86_15675 [Acidobacteria bacterium AB60]|nr:hypothetical protein DYQ86_15675 [Acidobacteria bacterium AB60]
MEPKVVVIGGSAGSVGAIVEIVRALPRELNAAVFVAVHSVSRQRTFLRQREVSATTRQQPSRRFEAPMACFRSP